MTRARTAEAPDRRVRPDGHSESQALSATFARGLEVLAVMMEEPPRVDAAAERLHVPLSTVYRYVRTAKALGFLEERDGRYVPGLRLLHLARREHWHERLAALAQPVLQALVRDLHESAFLLVREGTQAVCLASVETPRAVRLSFDPGSVRPLYAGASAKALLAFAPPALIEDVIRRGLEPLTDRTPDAHALLEQLAEIRREGVAVSTAELDPDASAVAAPVFADDELICALSVAGPASRFKAEHLAAARVEVANAGRALAQMLERKHWSGSSAGQKGGRGSSKS